MQSRKNDKNAESEPVLHGKEARDVERRMAPSAIVVHEAIRNVGKLELERSSSALGWSGLAAGLSMGFSMFAEGALQVYLPDAEWTPLVSRLGYSMGFLIVILGRQQLFTENTLTPILHLLQHRKGPILWNLLRLWLVVLVTNLAGAFLFAWGAARGGVFPLELQQAFIHLGEESLSNGFLSGVLSGIYAGWLIALIIWLMPFAETARVWIIIIVAYLIRLGEFGHIIAGSVETFFLVTSGVISWGSYFVDFFFPTLIGNMIGGIALVAVVNHAQVVAGGDTYKAS